jgi:hypothetical protein
MNESCAMFYFDLYLGRLQGKYPRTRGKEEAKAMRNTTTLERLTQKPLNAKYYPFDQEVILVAEPKKENFFFELSRFIVSVLSSTTRR